MYNVFRPYAGLVILFLTTGIIQADTTSAAGLWVGEVTLQRVNETVTGVNAANQVVSPDPSVTTPVTSPAHMRIIFHVDTNGVVRLLKGVAMVNRATGSTNPPDIVLLSNPSLYAQYGNLPGQRLTAVAFDFGDGPAAQNALDAIAGAAAAAVVNGTDPTAAANAVINSYQTNIPAGSSTAYANFIQSSTFSGTASQAATSAALSLVGVDASVAASRKIEIATLAAVNTLKDANVYAAADALTLNEVVMTGQLAAGGVLTGTIYLGADHPTNPFRHKWNPIERHGYAITRALTVTFDAAPDPNASALPGFGVDHITGTYHESILGLHKPLGPNQDIGLLTDGTITLQHISPVAVLNQ
ncbi:MAG: hypothetical protein P4N60_11050 [Verrucomicrobiae bacterium]|nr:hypothetical protein [Verrucomicrobiae bacterium]